jgi:hypothetical protein
MERTRTRSTPKIAEGPTISIIYRQARTDNKQEKNLQNEGKGTKTFSKVGYGHLSVKMLYLVIIFSFFCLVFRIQSLETTLRSLG